MRYRASLKDRIFRLLIHVVLIFAAFLCLLPLINVLAISLSSRSAVEAGKVTLLPMQITLSSYKFILSKSAFVTAFWISVKRVLIGTSLNMALVLLVAYPLSKESRDFKMRTVYSWIFLVTILFSGGLIPTYMTVRMTGILDTIWSLVLPGAVQVFFIILMLNFFRRLPKEIDDSAAIDGAGHFTILVRMYIPLSPAAIATITLFASVQHWNSWFDGMIYMNSAEHYPLQTYLRSIIIKMQGMLEQTMPDSEQWELLDKISDRTAIAAQIFVGMLPIVTVYPFLQRYFIKGMVLGSVKG